MALHFVARAATVLHHVLPNRQCDQRDQQLFAIKPSAAVANSQFPNSRPFSLAAGLSMIDNATIVFRSGRKDCPI
jgi:hypothetical protein